MNCPYIVELKLGSLGSLGFYEEKVSWTGSGWSESRTKITTSTVVTSTFTANTSLSPSARSETYITNLRTSGGTQELMTSDKYLIYGHYNLSASAYGYRTYSEAVEAKVFGMDNAAGKYSGYTSPYEYPIVMRSPKIHRLSHCEFSLGLYFLLTVRLVICHCRFQFFRILK